MRRAALVAATVVLGMGAAWGVLRTPPMPEPPPSPPPRPAAKAPRPIAPPSPPQPAPPRPEAPEVPAAGPGPSDPDVALDALGFDDLTDAPDDHGPEVTPARMRAAQLHLIPVTTDPPLPGDPASVDDALDRLKPGLSACLGDDAEGEAELEVQSVPMPDGQASALQVTRLPDGHDGDADLACFTEALRTVRFEWGAPHDHVVVLDAP